MLRPHLRLYTGSDMNLASSCEGASQTVSDERLIHKTVKRGERVRVRLAEAIPLLTRAMEERLAWVDDFDEETIDVSPDLFELLATYRRFVD